MHYDGDYSVGWLWQRQRNRGESFESDGFAVAGDAVDGGAGEAVEGEEEEGPVAAQAVCVVFQA